MTLSLHSYTYVTRLAHGIYPGKVDKSLVMQAVTVSVSDFWRPPIYVYFYGPR